MLKILLKQLDIGDENLPVSKSIYTSIELSFGILWGSVPRPPMDSETSDTQIPGKNKIAWAAGSNPLPPPLDVGRKKHGSSYLIHLPLFLHHFHPNQRTHGHVHPFHLCEHQQKIAF